MRNTQIYPTQEKYWKNLSQNCNLVTFWQFNKINLNSIAHFNSSVLTYTLVVHSIALYWLGGAQDDFACLLRTNREMVYNAVLSVSVRAYDNK